MKWLSLKPLGRWNMPWNRLRQQIRFLTLHLNPGLQKALGRNFIQLLNIFWGFKVCIEHEVCCSLSKYETLRPIPYHLYSLKSVKNTHGRVLITKSNTPPWVFLTFFKLYKRYQIIQSITYRNIKEATKYKRVNKRRTTNCKSVKGVFTTLPPISFCDTKSSIQMSDIVLNMTLNVPHSKSVHVFKNHCTKVFH